MKTQMRSGIPRVALILFCAALPARAYAVDVPGPLVEPAWVAGHLDSIRVLDVRTDPGSFTQAGHVPGAVMLDARRIQAARPTNGTVLQGMVPGGEEFAALMRAHGVDRRSAVVISSAGRDTVDATYMARLYWTLKYYGHDNVAILDGGTARWAQENRRLGFERSAPGAGDFRVTGPPRKSLRATTQDVARVLQHDSTQLVDARTLGYYLGIYKEPYVEARGHIPGAAIYPYALALDGARFRPRADLEALAGALGVRPDSPLIVYCNTGVLSAAGWFIFHELLGNEDAVLYDGSMHAWSQGGRRPVETMKLNLD